MTIPPYASYRDPRSSIAADGNFVYRDFDSSGAEAFLTARSNGVLQELVDSGLLVDHEIVSDEPLRLKTPLIPFVTYPDEWTPQMLQEAGLLTLEITKRLWAAGLHLRDASAYNVVFAGVRPIFVDLGSIGIGHTPTWTAYSQFCDHFLAPLLIEAHLGVPFRAVWSLEGVPASTAGPLFRGTSRLKKGVLTNLILRSKLEASHSDDSLQERAAIRKELTLSPQSVGALFEKMERLVGRLEFQRETTWGDYERTNSYADEEQTVRDDVIEDFVSASQNTGWALDVGANTGRHSALLAKTFDNVISVDIDEVAVEVHRRRLIEAPPAGTIFPVLADLAAPTSASGFLLEERQDLLQRISGVDATIWMAVIHHLVIGRSVPLSGVAEMAYRIGERHLIEFVDPADLMVQLLSASKNAEHHLYTKEAFVEAFSTKFHLREVAQPTPTRYIFEAAIE